MKTTILQIALLLAACGCATNYTKTTTAPDGTRTTEARSKSFAAGKSQLRDFTAKNSDKQQSLGLGSMANESDAAPLAAVMGQIMVEGFKAYMTGGASTLSRQSAPAGYKLVPKDDPSKAQPEIAQ